MGFGIFPQNLELFFSLHAIRSTSLKRDSNPPFPNVYRKSDLPPPRNFFIVFNITTQIIDNTITLIQHENWPIHEYSHVVKALVDAIALIDHPITDNNLTLYVLNGLDANF